MTDWLDGITERLAGYLDRLQVPGQTGRFRPATSGLTPAGEQVALGFSCYAHKIYYTLGLWEQLEIDEQQSWNDFIKSFQVQGNPLKDSASTNAFLDPVVVDYLARQEKTSVWRRLRRRGEKGQTYLQAVIRSETKQALATLAQVGAVAHYLYRGFPSEPKQTNTYLENLDWQQPWAAGAHVATLSVFYQTQAPRFLSSQAQLQLLDTCRDFVRGTLDEQTGAYFIGPPPDHGVLINGAMKVLTALDWLEEPIHRPELLIDTCLARLPRSEGCHLVDAVYVLYRCARQTDHRRREIQAYCRQVLEMLQAHFIPAEGGFSYHIGASQTMYYGVLVTEGHPVADIHGTILLVWALAMICVLLEENPAGWRVIRP